MMDMRYGRGQDKRPTTQPHDMNMTTTHTYKKMDK